MKKHLIASLLIGATILPAGTFRYRKYAWIEGFPENNHKTLQLLHWHPEFYR